MGDEKLEWYVQYAAGINVRALIAEIRNLYESESIAFTYDPKHDHLEQLRVIVVPDANLETKLRSLAGVEMVERPSRVKQLTPHTASEDRGSR